MSDRIREFFIRLDGFYDVHDNEGAEQYMLEQARLPFPEPEEETDRDQLFSDSCLYTASVYNELACHYRGMSRFEEATDSFEAARQMLKTASLEESDLYATVLLNEAGVWRYMGETEQALELFREAGEMLDRPENRDNEEALAGLWNNTGLVHLDRKEPHAAMHYFHKALQLVTQSERFLVQQSVTWNNIANALMMTGDLPRAEAAVRESIRILQALKSEEDSHYPAAVNTLGVICFRQGRYEEALEQFEKALELTAVFYGENIEYASGCANCAFTCEAMGRNEEAAAWKEKADRIRKRLLAGQEA